MGKGEWTNGGDILARSDGDELTEEGRSKRRDGETESKKRWKDVNERARLTMMILDYLKP